MLQKNLHVTISLFERGLLNKKNLLIWASIKMIFQRLRRTITWKYQVWCPWYGYQTSFILPILCSYYQFCITWLFVCITFINSMLNFFGHVSIICSIHTSSSYKKMIFRSSLLKWSDLTFLYIYIYIYNIYMYICIYNTYSILHTTFLHKFVSVCYISHTQYKYQNILLYYAF